MRFLEFSSVSIALLSGVARCAQTVSKQVELGGNSYFLPPTKAWSFQSWKPTNQSSDEFLPLTVVRLNNSAVNVQEIRAIFETYNATDDVWTPGFTQGKCPQSTSAVSRCSFHYAAIFFEHPGKHFHWSPRSSLAPDYTVGSILDSASNKPDISNVPRGPYFLETRTGDVYRAYKLVNDFNQAFIQVFPPLICE